MDQMGFLGFFLKRMSNRVRPALELEPTADEISFKKVSLLFPITHGLGDASKNKRKLNAEKKVAMNHIPKKGAELNLSDRGTGIPCNDKRAHAPGREQSAYCLVAKITSFLSETPSDSFKYVLNEESQK